MIDAICYVLANDRRADTVLRVLERFLAYHDPIIEDYEEFGVEYTSEHDMLHYFQDNPHVAVSSLLAGSPGSLALAY
jgi:hypothetical protein